MTSTMSCDVVLITHLLMTQAWTGNQWEGPGILVVLSQVHLVDFELVAHGEGQKCLHGLDESCDQMSPLPQMEAGNKVMLGLPNFHLLPGVRLETLYVSG